MDDAVPEHFTASLAGRQSARSQILLTYLTRSTNFWKSDTWPTGYTIVGAKCVPGGCSDYA